MPLPKSRHFMDYVMRFNGKLLPVETKLAVSAEPNIVAQVSKYVYNSNVFLDRDEKRCVTGADFYDGKVLIIDTEKLYMYDDAAQSVNEIFNLDQITSKADLKEVKRVIKESL